MADNFALPNNGTISQEGLWFRFENGREETSSVDREEVNPLQLNQVPSKVRSICFKVSKTWPQW